MTDLKSILDIVSGLQTPILGYLCWLVYRIKTNDIVHLQESLNHINERLSRVEGWRDAKSK